jgi:hypothetical protein
MENPGRAEIDQQKGENLITGGEEVNEGTLIGGRWTTTSGKPVLAW